MESRSDAARVLAHHQIVPAPDVSRGFDVAAEIARRTDFHGAYLRASRLRTPVPGASDGIDSAMAERLGQLCAATNDPQYALAGARVS